MTYFPMLLQENPSRNFLCICEKGNFYHHVKGFFFRGGKILLLPLACENIFMIFEKKADET
jgi:hypothetical protein